MFSLFKSSSFRLFTFKITYQIKKKLAVSCWLVSTFIYRIIHIRRNEFRNQSFHQDVSVFRFLHTESVQSTQRLHREHIVNYFKFSIRSFNQLSFQWVRHQISLISSQSSSKQKYLYLYHNSEESKSLFWAFSLFLLICFSVHDIEYFQNDVSNHLIANITIYALRHDFESKFEKRFHLFFCVLTTNEHRMHAQKSVKKDVFLSYEMTRYSRTFFVLIILSLRFKSELFSRINQQKRFSSTSSSSSFSSQIFVRFHDCRVRCEFHTSTNKSWRSRISSIDEKRKKNELIASKRNWKKTRNNVTSVHRI